jgi:hypothetical protein
MTAGEIAQGALGDTFRVQTESIVFRFIPEILVIRVP